MAAFDFNTTNPKEHKIQCEEALEKTIICLNLIYIVFITNHTYSL